MDGTLLPLECRPINHEETFFTRKMGYAIHMLVVCDHRGLITYDTRGWPGSVHENRVWRNCNIKQRYEDYFDGGQCMLTDSAFICGTHIIPALKCASGSAMGENESSFNDLLTKPRVKSEHCIGLLKGRFLWLRNIRASVKNEIVWAAYVTTLKHASLCTTWWLKLNLIETGVMKVFSRLMTMISSIKLPALFKMLQRTCVGCKSWFI